MFIAGEVVDEKYLVEGMCNDSGGMGALLFVKDITDDQENQLVLKYCREIAEEPVKRFKREVRLLAEYEGNSKVVQLVDFNVENEPPYFVMRFYEKGDLTNIIDAISDDAEEQERIFVEMIECVSELHARDQYHRDIKPQNFLISDDGIHVSDFGLSMEIDSGTGFTRSTMYWGTPGYIPPEFLRPGGFKNADASGDVFMLGKSFYVLLTKRDPMYLLADDVAPSVFHVIERACSINKEHRYQSLSELKQSLAMAYDVILHRGGGLGETQQLLSAINDKLEQEQKYSSAQVVEFIEKLVLLERSDKIRMCFEVDRRFFAALRQPPVVDHMPEFLGAYQQMVESEDYGWSYAETIAKNMKTLFLGEDVPNKQKATALELAIDAAYRMHRFAAMDTCREMITGVTGEELGIEVASVLLRNKHAFIETIEPSECKSEQIRSAINALQKQSEENV